MLLEKIKKVCEEKHLSLAQVEKEAGLGKNTIFRWDPEKNGSVVPTIDKVRRVADVLGVTVNDLLDYESETDPELALAIRAAEERPELRVLFSLGSKATKEDVEAVIRLLDR